MDNPSKHFAYKYHLAKELANELKSSNINGIKTDYRLQKRLKFYGINKGNNYEINNKKDENHLKSVTISYFYTPIKTFYVSKLHK
jgi:hypothetical protein